MLERFAAGIIGLLKNVLVITILFCIVVGLVLFAKSNPAAWQALVTKGAEVAVKLVMWLLSLLDQLIPDEQQ